MSGSSLIPFHRVLITVGILFCLGYAGWSFLEASRSGGVTSWVLGGVFALLAVVLMVYLGNLSRLLGYRDD